VLVVGRPQDASCSGCSSRATVPSAIMLALFLCPAIRKSWARAASSLGVISPVLTRSDICVSRSSPGFASLAHQAADDALVAVMAKLGRFRGESRFTTWAYKFAVLEVSAKLGRHFWQRPAVTLEAGQWDQLPDRLGLRPDELAEHAELLAALRRAVAEDLTERQRHVFTAIVVDGVPLDALVVQLGSSRNAIYKTMFDARRKLRAALAANGYLDDDDPGCS